MIIDSRLGMGFQTALCRRDKKGGFCRVAYMLFFFAIKNNGQNAIFSEITRRAGARRQLT